MGGWRQAEHLARGIAAFPKPISHRVLDLAELCGGHILRTAGIGVTGAPTAEVKRGQWKRDKSGKGEVWVVKDGLKERAA